MQTFVYLILLSLDLFNFIKLKFRSLERKLLLIQFEEGIHILIHDTAALFKAKIHLQTFGFPLTKMNDQWPSVAHIIKGTE